MAVLTSKETYIKVYCKTSRSPHPPTRILKVYIVALTGFSHIISPDVLNTTLFFQGYILQMAASMRIVGNVFSTVRIEDKEPPVARVQFRGQPVVTSP